MLEITGKVHLVHPKNDKSIQIVIKKRIKKKEILIALDVWGWEKSNVEKLRLVKGDRIWAKLYIKSRIYNNKWYSDVYVEQVQRIDKVQKPKKGIPPGTQARMLYS